MVTSQAVSPTYRKPHTGRQRRTPLTGVVNDLGITVYSCEPDEADLFHELGPRFGVVPTITGEAVSASNALSVAGNRCISVGHKAELPRSALHALHDAGVEHVSTRSIGTNHIDLGAAA